MQIKMLLPIFLLIILLSYNVFFEGGAWLGDYTNQYILLVSSLFTVLLGYQKTIGVKRVFGQIYHNLKTVLTPVLILLLVGALTGAWLVSGVVPTMVYYGLQILNPVIFLPACVVISALVSLATGSSWTTSATVGVALVGVGVALGIPMGVVAGAIISGAYFGDKMSPLSDTTNLAPAMAGTDLYTHIKYMFFTTVPSISLTLILFTVIGFNLDTKGVADVTHLLEVVTQTFVITPYLFVVPITVLVLILMKTPPLISLFIGVVLGAVFAYIFQAHLLLSLSGSLLETIFKAIFVQTEIQTSNAILNNLFVSKGMLGMNWTIFLIASAMIFGAVMESVGFLPKITQVLLGFAKSTFSLFFSTVVSCLGLNVITSDQYLSIVIPGRMFKEAYRDRNLAPENLSRTLEDSATVTSVLIPWNTCGAYQASVLGVDTASYVFYCFFNYLSPLLTLFFAAFKLKIRTLKNKQ